MVSKSFPLGMRLNEQGKWREIMAMIGIDVSKAKLDCMWLRDPVSLKVKSKVLPNTVSGYQALLVWLTRQTGEADGGHRHLS